MVHAMNIHDLARMRQEARKVTKKELEEIRSRLVKDSEIADSIARLCALEPFYESVFGPFVKRVRVDDPNELPTMSVSLNGCHDGFILRWNPRFWKGLTILEQLDLLRHEAGHIINDHLILARELSGFQLKTNQHKLINASLDLAINDPSYLKHLPNGGWVPGKPLMRASVDDSGGFVYDDEGKPVLAPLQGGVSSFMVGMKAGLTNEEYYDLLVTHASEGEDLEAPNYIGVHSWFGDKSGEGTGGGSPYLDPDERIALKSLSESVKASIRSKVNELDNTNGWGSTSMGMREKIRIAVAPYIDWRAILRRVIGSSVRTGKHPSWRHMSRRTPWAAPGTRHEYRPGVHAYLDVSGSHDDVAVGMCFDVFRQISSLNEIMVYQFDTAIDEGEKWKKNYPRPSIRKGCGGTDFRVPRQHADDSRNVDLAIILTDGECMDPGPPKGKYKLVWLITPNGSVQDWMSHYGSIAIKMADDKATIVDKFTGKA